MKTNLILFILIPIIGISQPRISENRPSISKTTVFLKNIIGWKYNEYSGKWISEKNNAGYFMCNQLQFRNIIVEDKKYYVLTISEDKGYYTYPAIKLDWHSYKAHRSYIFNESEYEKIKLFNNATSNFSEMNTLEDENIQDYVYNNIKSGFKPYCNYVFQLKKENENTVRFILPFSIGQEYLSKEYTFENCYFEVSLSDFLLLIK